MPDFPALTLALAGLLFFGRWLERARWLDYTIAVLAIASALLIKLPMITIGSALAARAWQKEGAAIFRRPALWLFALLVMLPAAAWYWHANQIARRFYPYHFFGAGGIRLMGPGWYAHVATVAVQESLTFLLTLLALAGLWATRKQPGLSLWRWYLLGSLLFGVVAGYGNRHPWYQLPLVPIAAVFGGYAAILLARRSSLLTAAVLLLFFGTSFLAWRWQLRSSAQPGHDLGRAVEKNTPPGSLLAVADDCDPTALYYAHRRGWHLLERHGLFDGNPGSSAQVIADLEQLRARGATHLGFLRGTVWWLQYYPGFADYLRRSATLVEAQPNFQLYQFQKP